MPVGSLGQVSEQHNERYIVLVEEGPASSTAENIEQGGRQPRLTELSWSSQGIRTGQERDRRVRREVLRERGGAEVKELIT